MASMLPGSTKLSGKPKNGKGNSKTLKVGGGNKKPAPIKGGKK